MATQVQFGNLREVMEQKAKFDRDNSILVSMVKWAADSVVVGGVSTVSEEDLENLGRLVVSVELSKRALNGVN